MKMASRMNDPKGQADIVPPVKSSITITGVTSDGGSSIGTIGSAPNLWGCSLMTGLNRSAEGKRLLEVFNCFDPRRLQEVHLDGMVIGVLTGAEQALSLGSPNKHQALPGAITLTRVGREHDCKGQQSDCNLFWHGPRACMLEANGFIAFANGADFAEVCRKWKLPPPPTPLGPKDPDPAGVTSPQIAVEVRTEDARSIPQRQAVDQPPPASDTEAKNEARDALECSTSSATLSTQSATLSEDQRSWQTECESTLAGDTNKLFARHQVLPLTFHVLSGSSRAVVEAMIIERGGGVIVPRNRATILVDPTRIPDSEVWVSTDNSRAMVPHGWILDSLALNRLVGLKEYAAREA